MRDPLDISDSQAENPSESPETVTTPEVSQKSSAARIKKRRSEVCYTPTNTSNTVNFDNVRSIDKITIQEKVVTSKSREIRKTITKMRRLTMDAEKPETSRSKSVVMKPVKVPRRKTVDVLPKTKSKPPKIYQKFTEKPESSKPPEQYYTARRITRSMTIDSAPKQFFIQEPKKPILKTSSIRTRRMTALYDPVEMMEMKKLEKLAKKKLEKSEKPKGSKKVEQIPVTNRIMTRRMTLDLEREAAANAMEVSENLKDPVKKVSTLERPPTKKGPSIKRRRMTICGLVRQEEKLEAPPKKRGRPRKNTLFV